MEKNPLLQSQTLEIAALFHDIGKFKQHGIDGSKPKHEILSAELIDQINLPKNIDKKDVKKIIKDHHSRDTSHSLSLFLKFADWRSAQMDRETDEDDQPNRPLISIFSETRLPEKSWVALPNMANYKKQAYYLPLPLTVKKESLFPLENVSENELISYSSQAWKAFTDELKKIPEGMTFDAWITTVEALLKKYTINVTSAAHKTKPKISLYNHLTTTAAISKCLKDYREEHPSIALEEEDPLKIKKYLVVKGDINGIQKFIFKVKNPQKARKATSKRLRGRSFVVQLLSDAALNSILDRLGLSPNHVIIDVGGSFTLLIPNTKSNKQKLKEITQEINTKIKKQFNQDLRLTIAYIEISTEDLNNFQDVEKRLSNELKKKKMKPYYELLFDENNKLNYENAYNLFFKVPEQTNPLIKCVVCETPIDPTFSLDDEKEICSECKQHEIIGGALTKAISLLRVKLSSDKKEVFPALKDIPYYSILDYRYYFVSEGDEETIFSNIKNGVLISFSPDNFLKENALQNNIACTFKFLGLSLPSLGKQLLSFDQLAKLGIGYQSIAIFKADIDNLGYIITSGILGEQKDRSISLIKELALRLDLFFSGYLSEITKSPAFSIYDHVCEEHKELFYEIQIDSNSSENNDNDASISLFVLKNRTTENISKIKQCKNCNRISTAIYSIFAGGDDIALAGPWDMIIDLAMHYREELEKYVAMNPLFTISGGIGLYEEKYPIGRAIQETEELLERSKNLLKTRIEIDGGEIEIPVKNSITLFEDTVFWEKNNEYYNYYEPSFGSFKELLKNAKTYEEKINNDNAFPRTFVHFLLLLWETYLGELSPEDVINNRTSETRYYPIISFNVARRYENPKEIKENFELIQKTIPWMRIIASWALYRTKKVS